MRNRDSQRAVLMASVARVALWSATVPAVLAVVARTEELRIVSAIVGGALVVLAVALAIKHEDLSPIANDPERMARHRKWALRERRLEIWLFPVFSLFMFILSVCAGSQHNLQGVLAFAGLGVFFLAIGVRARHHVNKVCEDGVEKGNKDSEGLP